MGDDRNLTQEYLDKVHQKAHCMDCGVYFDGEIGMNAYQYELIYGEGTWPSDDVVCKGVPVQLGTCGCGEVLCQNCAVKHRCGGS